jgi:cytochrome c peroxidase
VRPDQPAQKPLLDALAAYVNYAIPTPVPPSTDVHHVREPKGLAAARERGEQVFERIGCAVCHSGPAHTDSGAGNDALDLSGPVVTAQSAGGVLLHDVGTCTTADRSPTPDVAHADIEGHARAACAFDTPQLRGLWDSAPYLHDGSAETLDDVVTRMLDAVAQSGEPLPDLDADDRAALVEYLRGL